jgi:hypothetical protein
MRAILYRFESCDFVWRRWFWEPPPVPGDVRLSTCPSCWRGIWNSQVKCWTGAARFLWPGDGRCQECQGYGPVCRRVFR